ncbi:Hypothetical protein Ccan_03000 [Capnocytophaga canimorsus Cc5]|uniref:Uncharacterized protein n=1 Tax=Capnocytophaga canimorsus (strain 5) TaxID=860228 RepID=F9YR64_CAPCC|nr:Hypothetical protein Ccan_03000 [Capnocytophaga canimorsus Cc5]
MFFFSYLSVKQRTEGLLPHFYSLSFCKDLIKIIEFVFA